MNEGSTQAQADQLKQTPHESKEMILGQEIQSAKGFLVALARRKKEQITRDHVGAILDPNYDRRYAMPIKISVGAKEKSGEGSLGYVIAHDSENTAIMREKVEEMSEQFIADLEEMSDDELKQKFGRVTSWEEEDSQPLEEKLNARFREVSNDLAPELKEQAQLLFDRMTQESHRGVFRDLVGYRQLPWLLYLQKDGANNVVDAGEKKYSVATTFPTRESLIEYFMLVADQMNQEATPSLSMSAETVGKPNVTNRVMRLFRGSINRAEPTNIQAVDAPVESKILSLSKMQIETIVDLFVEKILTFHFEQIFAQDLVDSLKKATDELTNIKSQHEKQEQFNLEKSELEHLISTHGTITPQFIGGPLLKKEMFAASQKDNFGDAVFVLKAGSFFTHYSVLIGNNEVFRVYDIKDPNADFGGSVFVIPIESNANLELLKQHDLSFLASIVEENKQSSTTV